jgi:mRNA interferase MazF
MLLFLIGYPFTNLQGIKVRPAIIISPDAFNLSSVDRLFILITSNLTRESEFEVNIDSGHAEFSQTGLRRASVIRVSKLMMLDKSLIKGTIGSLGPTLRLDVEKQLRLFLDLSAAIYLSDRPR